jgi:membrane AbrB-like protein
MLKTTAIFIGVGLAGGLIGWRLKLPGGVIVGSMILVVLYKLFNHQAGSLPFAYKFGVQVLIGTLVGSMFEPEMLTQLRAIVLPMALSTLILVSTGLLIALLLSYFRLLDVTTAYLATSPGGMSATIGLAFSSQAEPLLVLTFHFVRILFINLSAPLVFYLLQRWSH